MRTDQGKGQAGTLESGDILVLVDLKGSSGGITIDLQSPSLTSFGRQIRTVVKDTLHTMNITDAYIKAEDRGALDCTIAARVEAAAGRALSSYDKEGERCL